MHTNENLVNRKIKLQTGEHVFIKSIEAIDDEDYYVFCNVATPDNERRAKRSVMDALYLPLVKNKFVHPQFYKGKTIGEKY